MILFFMKSGSKDKVLAIILAVFLLFFATKQLHSQLPCQEQQKAFSSKIIRKQSCLHTLLFRYDANHLFIIITKMDREGNACYNISMLYFAYGSNMNSSHMQRRCPKTTPLGPALLRGWRVAFLYPSTSFPGGGAADIVPKKKGEVWGVLWKTTADDLLRLDEYEDVSSGGYRRVEVDLFFKAEQKRAISYEVCDKLDEELAPRRDYLETMLQGAREAGLPEDYIKSFLP